LQVTKPNFFLIGAPKCGTTAVDKALGQHPEIFMSSPKEPSYFLFTGGNPYGFDPETRVSDRAAYLALFDGAAEKKVRGEASPLYLHGTHIAADIHELNPDGKIMAILRDPVERACSMYLFFHQYDRHARLTPEDFRRRFLDGTLCHAPVREARMTMEFLKAFGFYHELLKPYYELFPRENILIVAHDELKADSAAFARHILAFLEVDQSWPTPITPENVTFAPKNREINYWLNHATASAPRQMLKRLFERSGTARAIRDSINRANQQRVALRQFLTDDLHRDLIETYRADIMRLSELVGIDFTPWLERKAVRHLKPAAPEPAAISQ
jgi:DNA polymerase III psi subunit